MRTHKLTLLLAFALATSALAGCATPDDEPTTPTPSSPTPVTPTTPTPSEPGNYTLTASGMPRIVAVGNAFNFSLVVEGPEGTTDHVGAHFADNTTAFPSAPGRGDCVHQTQATLPNTFQVTCTITQSGTWYVYGHLQTLDGETRNNHWASPIEVTAYDYQIVLELDESAGLNATFTANLTGAPADSANAEAAASNGIYWSLTSTTQLSTTLMTACETGFDAAPGEFTATCEFAAPGTYYVFGHYRVIDGEFVETFWSAPYEITVTA